MCGIAGIVRIHRPGDIPPPEVSIPEAWLDVLDEAVKHRGPDGHGRFRDRAVRPDGAVVDVALVHRRLSILDHEGGHQPMLLPGGGAGLQKGGGSGFQPVSPGSSGVRTTSPGLGYTPPGADPEPYRRTAGRALKPCPRCAARGGGTVAVVFNGCIYNHRGLRRELEAAGHEFSTDHSDTEVLAHGYRQWGDELSARLDGMYAYLLWDPSRGDLFAGRDFAQEKPLFAMDTKDGMAFCSVAAGLARLNRHLQGGAARSSEDWLADWIRFGGSSEPAIAGVFRWPYRAMLHCSSEWREQSNRFTQLPQRDGSICLDADTVDRLIAESVASRLDADVPSGCFLSGGIDSSLVSLYAKRAAGDIRTFCVRMPDRRYDESEHAENAARLIGSDHTTLDCLTDPATDVQQLVRRIGLPFGDSSLLPAFWVNKAAGGSIKVALSGDGGDELFCGYERHAAAPMLRRTAALVSRIPARLLPDRDPKHRLSKARRMVSAARSGYRELVAVFQMPDLRRLLPGLDFAWYRLGRFDEHDPASIDFYGYLADDLLLKSDTASMSAPLELRAPFLSNALAGACLRAPLADLMPRGQRKGLLRAVARKYFPPEIVDRPKQGFAIPIGEWFRSDYGGMRQLLRDHLESAEPFGPDGLGINAMINIGYVKQMLREHDDAGEPSLWPWKGRDHSQRLYMLLVLSIWAKWLGG